MAAIYEIVLLPLRHLRLTRLQNNYGRGGAKLFCIRLFHLCPKYYIPTNTHTARPYPLLPTAAHCYYPLLHTATYCCS